MDRSSHTTIKYNFAQTVLVGEGETASTGHKHTGGGQATYTQHYIGHKGSLSSGQAVCRCKVTISKHCYILHNMIITIVLDHFLYTISSNYLTMLWHYITLKSLRNQDLYLYRN